MNTLDDMSFFLDNYKNNYVAHHLNNTPENKKLLYDTENKINSLLNNLTNEKNRMVGENKKTRTDIEKVNNKIKKVKKQHSYLAEEATRLVNSDLGAIEQNENTNGVNSQYKRKIFFEIILLATILMFLYINGNIIQTIRNKLPTDTK